MWHKAEWIGHPMRLDVTLASLQVKLADHYTTRGTVSRNSSSHQSDAKTNEKRNKSMKPCMIFIYSSKQSWGGGWHVLRLVLQFKSRRLSIAIWPFLCTTNKTCALDCSQSNCSSQQLLQPKHCRRFSFTYLETYCLCKYMRFLFQENKTTFLCSTIKD